MVEQIIWAVFVVSVLRQSTIPWTQMAREEELGACIPTVFQGDIMMILLNTERIRWNNNDGFVHTEISTSVNICVYTSMYTYIPH